MSPSLRRKAAHAGPVAETGVTAQRLAERLEALEAALVAGGEQLDPAKVARADEVVAKVHERIGLTGGHTVVALAGATGSGKSTLFNAIVGEDVARPGVRRPTTSTPTAAIHGDEPAGALLDWLKVGTRHQVAGAAGTELDGLVLLDLPDFDSFEMANRAEAERVIGLADIIVWVTDPQKYADARLHDDFVATLSDYDAVMLVVLNQVDRLSEAQVQQCLTDLRRILVRDGITEPRVIATSGVAGTGVDELRAELASAVQGSTAARLRLAADLTTSASSLHDEVGPTEADPDTLVTDDLVDALSRAAGVPTVVDAVARDFRQESIARAGWPFSRWLQALRPDPLRRLRPGQSPDAPRITEADVRRVLGRSSIPPPTPAARAAVDLATRRLGDRAAQGAAPRWADAIEEATPTEANLSDSLDRAVVSTPLRGRPPVWWKVIGVLQIVAAPAVVVGVVWLTLLGVGAWLQIDIPTPDVGPFATPFLLLAAGLLLGLLLSLLTRALAAGGARARARAVDRRLRANVREVAETELVSPVVAVLDRHARTRQELRRAGQ